MQETRFNQLAPRFVEFWGRIQNFIHRSVKCSWSVQTQRGGSLERKLYERSSAQWAHARDGENYQVMPSNEMLRITRLLKEYKLAYLTFRVPIGIVLGMECAEADRKYSNFHVSTHPIMVENGVLITSFAIDPEVQRRYVKYFGNIFEDRLNQV